MGPEKQVPFDFAQGRLSPPLKSASLRMTILRVGWIPVNLNQKRTDDAS
jgi:hypothetical protein